MGCNIINTISDRILGIRRDRQAIVKGDCKRGYHAHLAYLDALALSWAQRASAIWGVPVLVPVPVNPSPRLDQRSERTTTPTGTTCQPGRAMRPTMASRLSGFSRSFQS